MDKSLKEYFKAKKLSDENFNDYLRIIYNVFIFIIWHGVIPSFAGIGFLFYTAKKGDISYLSSFFLAVALSNMITIWNKDEYAKEGTKAINRIKKRKKEISKIAKKLKRVRK